MYRGYYAGRCMVVTMRVDVSWLLYG